jgi:amidase
MIGRHPRLALPVVALSVISPLPAGSMISKGYLRTLVAVGAGIPLTQAWNLSGLPAVVVPVRAGDPMVGLQLVGRPDSESTLLSVAGVLERAR